MTDDYSHAVRYTPSRRYSRLEDPANIPSAIRFIRIQWLDLSSKLRYRVLPLYQFTRLVVPAPTYPRRPSISVTKVALGIVGVSYPEGFSAVGEYVYVFDTTSLRVFTNGDSGYASVMGWFEEKVPRIMSPVFGGGMGVKVEICPRTTLSRIVENAKKLNTSFLVGFETEFILLKSTNPITPVNRLGWSEASSLPSGSPESKVLEDIASELEASGIEVLMYHAEAAPGQYEVVTGPLPPLQAADALVHTRETICNVASRYGLRATLAPRVFGDTCGSAGHMHISVHSETTDEEVPAGTLTRHESSFLASVLAHLRSLTPLLLPLPSSYDRIQDGIWSGGTYIHYGSENRESPIRICHRHAPASTTRNFEIKCIDGISNPYLALAGVIGVGINGIEEKLQLQMKDVDESEGKTAAAMSDDERRERGITQRMPRSIAEAREAMREGEVLKKVLGEVLVERFLAVNKKLEEAMTTGLGEAEDLRVLVEEY